MKLVTAKIIAEKLTSYLHHEFELAELVDWAENIMMDGDFEEDNYETLRNIVSRLGVADVKAFGLTWDECERFLKQLGYSVKIHVSPN
jgi:cobyrinic acid a,c-diamide synthase